MEITQIVGLKKWSATKAKWVKSVSGDYMADNNNNVGFYYIKRWYFGVTNRNIKGKYFKKSDMCL